MDAAPAVPLPADEHRHPEDCAPYFSTDSPELYHTRLDCHVGAAIPAAARRVDQTRLLERLPFW